MIQLTCANCRATLEVDDAFAGGVCRCQHCATIQTVPKPSNRPRAPGSASDEPRALYQVKQRSGTSSTPSGLEELAEVVHSSGLSGSGLINRSTRSPQAQSNESHPGKKPPIALWAGIGGAVMLGLIGLVVYLLLNDSPPAAPVANNAGNPETPAVAVPETPSFSTIALSGPRVIYLLDRGDATAGFFPPLKTLTTQSVRSLGSDKRFGVILWSNGRDDSYPRASMVNAVPAEADQLRRWFDEVVTGQATSVDSALARALAQSPDEIVLATGKSEQLDADFASTVLNARRGKATKIHAVTLGGTKDDDPLRKIALESGGTFKHLTASDLSNIGE